MQDPRKTKDPRRQGDPRRLSNPAQPNARKGNAYTLSGRKKHFWVTFSIIALTVLVLLTVISGFVMSYMFKAERNQSVQTEQAEKTGKVTTNKSGQTILNDTQTTKQGADATSSTTNANSSSTDKAADTSANAASKQAAADAAQASSYKQALKDNGTKEAIESRAKDAKTKKNTSTEFAKMLGSYGTLTAQKPTPFTLTELAKDDYTKVAWAKLLLLPEELKWYLDNEFDNIIDGVKLSVIFDSKTGAFTVGYAAKDKEKVSLQERTLTEWLTHLHDQSMYALAGKPFSVKFSELP